MKTSHIKFKNDEIEVGDFVFYVDGTISWIVDKNYGADLDGNRGVQMDWIEDGDLEVNNIEGNEVTKVEREIVLDHIQDNWSKYL